MSDRRSAKGFSLQLSIASVFVTVGGKTKLDFPDSEVEFFDGTGLDSGVSREDGEPTGYVKPGSVGGECFIDPEDSTHQEMLDLLSAPAKRSWQIINANISGFVCAFSGTLSKFQPTAAVGDGFKGSFSVKLASLATYSYPS